MMRKMSQSVASMRRRWASWYIHSAPTKRAMTPTAQRARKMKIHPSKNTWNAPFIRASEGEHVSRYFMVVRACAPERVSRLREGHLPRRAVRVRPAHRRIAHRVLEPAMFALDPDAGRQIVPVPRPLPAIGAGLRVGGAHHVAPIVLPTFNLSESLPRPRTKGRLQVDPLSSSFRLDLDRIADRPFAERFDQISDTGQRLSSDRRDHVTHLEPRAFRGRTRGDFRGEHAMAALDPIVGGQTPVGIVSTNAEPRPLDVSVRHNLAGCREGGIDRDGEADSLRVRDRRRVNRHDATAQIHKRATAVPGIHGRIRLDDRDPVPWAATQMPTQRADDARCDRRTSGETQRISDRQDRLPHLELL